MFFRILNINLLYTTHIVLLRAITIIIIIIVVDTVNKSNKMFYSLSILKLTVVCMNKIKTKRTISLNLISI